MKVLITSALPYANGPLHFGHIAGAFLPADCYARYNRLQGNDVLYVCGSDEYGVAITMSAEAAGRTPKEHVDIFHEINKNFFKQLNISFDHYSRTTWEGHKEPVQQFFLDLLENGCIEKRTTDQLYSEQDKKFLADRYVVGTCPKCGYEDARGDECQKCGASYEATDLKNPRSKATGSNLTLKPTTHWFLLFDKFKDQLQEWLATKDWKPNVVNFVKHYIDDLKPRAITRDSEWGIPVPLEEAKGKVLYVWFDAPIGYISATREWASKRGSKDGWKTFWLDEQTKLVNFIGKDNIPFHTIFFPAMIMGQNQPYKLVDDVPANEFLQLEGRQFSKSSNWYIDLDRFFTQFSTDQIRYTLAANAPEAQDAEFTWADFKMRCNAELVGKLGNFINRVLVFAQNQCEHIVPRLDNLGNEDQTFLARIDELAEDASHCYEKYRVRKATTLLMEMCAVGNAYFDARKPWKLAKEEETREELYTVIAACLYAIKSMSLVMFPLMPESAEKVWEMLGYKDPLCSMRWHDVIEVAVPEKQKLGKVEVVFQKVEDDVIEKEEMLLQSLGKEQSSANPLKEEISFDHFAKVDLRVGAITACEKVPKSSKLLKLQVDLGFTKKQILAGVAKEIKDFESLIGKQVVIVANLKPAKLMGQESQGMLLVAEGSDTLTPLYVEAVEAGASVR